MHIKNMVWIKSAAVVLALLFFWQCSSTDQKNNQTKMNILATTTIVGDVVSRVAAEKAEVHVLLPAGASPHSFEVAPRDMIKADRAEIIFCNGAGLEQFIAILIKNSGTKATIVRLSDSLPLRALAKKEEPHHDHHHHDHDHAHSGDVDPHVWFDPHLVIRWVHLIADTLSVLHPQYAEFFRGNAQAYLQELQELDTWIRDEVAQLPGDKRLLVSDHMLFGYFADRYGFKEIGAIIPGFSTLAEPSARDIARLEDHIRKMKVPAILVDRNVNPDLAGQITRDTGTKMVRIYSGSLSEKGGEADTYIKYMRYNVAAIIAALK